MCHSNLILSKASSFSKHIWMRRELLPSSAAVKLQQNIKPTFNFRVCQRYDKVDNFFFLDFLCSSSIRSLIQGLQLSKTAKTSVIFGWRIRRHPAAGVQFGKKNAQSAIWWMRKGTFLAFDDENCFWVSDGRIIKFWKATEGVSLELNIC